MKQLKQQFLEEQLTCLVKQGDAIYKETSNGVRPLLNFLDKGVLQESMIVDKVIGKAAAMLMIYGSVQEVYAFTISEHALATFQEHQVKVSYETLVPYIINRMGTGMCPMEEAVLDCQDVKEAYLRITAKVQAMQKQANS